MKDHYYLLQVSHLAQMKSLYPEVISLRYANIPKTTIQGQCSGIQLIIDMSLSDSAAEPASVSKAAAAPPQSAAKPAVDGSTSHADGSTAQTVPSSTQATIKAGRSAFAGDGLQSVSKASQDGPEQGRAEGLAVDSPSEPLHMMAIKAEFERRLEKQVSITS